MDDTMCGNGYSDILRAQGWGDRRILAGLTEGWINLYRIFRPDIVAADYAPTDQRGQLLPRLEHAASLPWPRRCRLSRQLLDGFRSA
jgi:hypothetical protein